MIDGPDLQIIRLDFGRFSSWPWPSIFKVKDFAISQLKMVRLPRNEMQTYRLNFMPQMWPSGLTLAATLTLNFQERLNMEFAIYQPKIVRLPRLKLKSKYFDWTLGLKCDQWVWHWPWPCPWIFKVKYGICYISTKNGPIAMKWKANSRPQMWPMGLTLVVILTLIFQSKMWPWPLTTCIALTMDFRGQIL